MFSPDWDAATQETVQNLSCLIRLETVNPPGNESLAVAAIKEILDREGISPGDAAILEGAPGRANLVVRLHGDGSRQALLLSGHTDVVPVEPERWSRAPFGGEVVDGCVWGRGAIDMKGLLAMYLQVFLLAHRLKLPLKRDLILAAVADEEAGYEHGSKYLVDHHPSLVKAEYGITESGAMTFYFGKVRLYPIQVSEKGSCWMKMRARGQPGHGSVTQPDNAVFHLATALEKIRRKRHLPVHLTSPFLSMMQAAGTQLGFPARILPALFLNPGIASFVLDRVPESSRGLLTSMVTNTVTPTMLRAGQNANVIPSVAEADLDCRKLPGQSAEDVMREILAVTGNEVELDPLFVSPGTDFPVDSPFYRTLVSAARTMDPDGVVVPMLVPGATDASVYQRTGVQIYGFTPGVLPEGFPILKMGHGDDERIPLSFIRSGLPVLWEVVTRTAL
jgi:acetylornithine deacetylase/succinyl-diaminopimelate desuccinylase-like protein